LIPLTPTQSLFLVNFSSGGSDPTEADAAASSLSHDGCVTPCGSTGYQYIPGTSPWNSNGTARRNNLTARINGIDFRTAAKVFLDPYVIEFDDLDAIGELRFNAIGLVEGRMIFVSYTMRGDVVRIISARGAEPHEKRKYHEI